MRAVSTSVRRGSIEARNRVKVSSSIVEVSTSVRTVAPLKHLWIEEGIIQNAGFHVVRRGSIEAAIQHLEPVACTFPRLLGLAPLKHAERVRDYIIMPFPRLLGRGSIEAARMLTFR